VDLREYAKEVQANLNDMEMKHVQDCNIKTPLSEKANFKYHETNE
jgi:hypothetical protein